MKNSSDINGNRTPDLPTCSAVPQTTAPPRTPIYITLITFLPLFKRWRIYYKIYTFLSLTEKDSNSGNVIRDFCWSRWHWDIAKWQNVCGPDRQENEIRYQEHITHLTPWPVRKICCIGTHTKHRTVRQNKRIDQDNHLRGPYSEGSNTHYNYSPDTSIEMLDSC